MKKNVIVILLLIILFSGLLRVFRLDYHDSYTDEASLSFRSISLIDYDASPTQTTPWQWFNQVPWWAHLSFHDHPILFFLIQHFSLKIFGINLIAVRVPTALAGIFSVVFIYLIGKKLFDEKTGLVAALLLSLQSYHLWVSRIGLQDGMVILLLLIAFWLMFKILENPRWWLLFGAVSGLALITKYTSLVIFFILAVFFIIYRYRFWRERYFWLGLLLGVIIISPVWLYNIFLYQATNHFDFQISAVLGQKVPEWSFRMGRELAGGLDRRFSNFWLALFYSNSPIFNFLALVAFLSAGWQILKNRTPALLLLIGATVIFFLWFLIIGSTYRFVVMIIPFLVLLIANLFQNLMKRSYKTFLACLAIFAVGEFLFSANSFFAPVAWGKENITYAKVSSEEKNFGFNELDDYLADLLKGQYTNFTGEPDYAFLQQLPMEHIEKMKQAGAKPLSIIIVYDDNFDFLSVLWVLSRRLYYEGWPIMNVAAFEKITGEELDSFYRKMGVEKFVYLRAVSEGVRAPGVSGESKSRLKERVDDLKIPAQVIKNRAGEDAFFVYIF